jgi:hypothetical protein
MIYLHQSMRSLWMRLLGRIFMRGKAASPYIFACTFILVWTSVPAAASGEMGFVYVVKSDPRDPAIVFAGAERGVFKSIDAGATWAATNLTQGTTGLTIAPVTPTTVYAGTNSGLFKSTDGGTTWSNAGVSSVICSVEIDSALPTTIYASTCGQILKSVDGGASWDSLSPPDESISRVAIAAGPPTILYAGSATDRVRIYSSTDGGVTWNNASVEHDVEYGWMSIVFDLSIDPIMPTTVYVNYSGWGDCDDNTCAVVTGAIRKSTDGGASWFPVDQVTYCCTPWLWDWGGPTITREVTVSPIAIDPLAPSDPLGSSTLYAAWRMWWSCVPWDISCVPGSAGWINKSSDGGASWSRISDLSASALWFDALTQTTLYAATDSGVLQSTDGGVTWSVAGAPAVTSLSLQPTSVSGGGTSTGTVTLSAAAPAGGTVVTLSSGNTAVATVPDGVTVPAGGTTATFTAATNPVTTSTTVTIFATDGGTTRFAQLVVTPAATLTSLSLQPTSVPAGSSATGTVTLSAPAPAGGAVVTLSSSNTAVTNVLASVTVPAGATTVGFVVTTNTVTSATVVTISATSGGVTRSATLTVVPATSLVSISLSPTSVRGGSPSTATITLSGAAPSGGVTVALSSSHPNIAGVPSSINVAAGATSAQVTVTTSRPKSPTDVTISASLANVTKAAMLTVRR